jgi:hypothetical protein
MIAVLLGIAIPEPHASPRRKRMKVTEAIWPAFGPDQDYACLRITEDSVMATAAVPRYDQGKIVISGARSSVTIDEFLKAMVLVCGTDNARKMFETALTDAG